VNSVSDQMEVAEVTLTVTIVQRAISKSFPAKFQIPTECPGYPVLQLIGREPFFSVFDVSFRMGYTRVLGKFTLKWVDKQHDPAKYKVGGRRLAGGSPSRRAR